MLSSEHANMKYIYNHFTHHIITHHRSRFWTGSAEKVLGISESLVPDESCLSELCLVALSFP